MVYVGFALVAATVVLHIYWWRDKASRWRYRDAGYIALGMYFGVQALASYQRHLRGWTMALFAVCAVGLVMAAIWDLWRGKRPEPQPLPQDPPL